MNVEGLVAAKGPSKQLLMFLMAIMMIVGANGKLRSLQASADEDTDNEDNKKKYVLWLILGGLILFLVLAAFIIETLLSRSKREEIEYNEQVRQQEEVPEKTQIESRVIEDSQSGGTPVKENTIREPLMEQNSQTYN